MPNLTNIDRLIDAIRTGDGRPEIGFNMASFVPTTQEDFSGRGCKTSCCIGGWVELLNGGGNDKYQSWIEITADFLGISWEKADILCYAWHMDYKDITAAKAIAVLEDLKATGRVNWLKGQTP